MFKNFKEIIVQTFQDWSQDRAALLAAALAYYAVFSIPPLLIIAIAIAGRVFDDAEARLTAEITTFIGETGGEAVAAMLENASDPERSVIATIIGVVTLLLGASGVFGQLQTTMNIIWEVPARVGRGILGTIKDRFFSFTMVLGIGFLLLVTLIISAALAGFNEFVNGRLENFAFVAQVINFVVSFGLTTLLFALIFKVVPDVDIAWRDVWVGALVTAALFSLGRWAIGLYLGRSAPGSTYGAAGSLIIVLLWVYYSAQILFLGAEFTQVYATHYGSRITAEGVLEARAAATRAAQGAFAAAPPPAPHAHSPANLPHPASSRPPRVLIGAMAVLVGVWRWLKGER